MTCAGRSGCACSGGVGLGPMQHMQHGQLTAADPVCLQVIFLDSDNVAVSDPTALLESAEYMDTGALLWPDYWSSMAAPDLAGILEIPALIPGSFESGQMVFDKRRFARPACPAPAGLGCPATKRSRRIAAAVRP